jgi:hypothetical protein
MSSLSFNPIPVTKNNEAYRLYTTLESALALDDQYTSYGTLGMVGQQLNRSREKADLYIPRNCTFEFFELEPAE